MQFKQDGNIFIIYVEQDEPIMGTLTQFCKSKEIVNAALEAEKDVTYLEIESSHGHDSFLFPEDRYVNAVKAFLGN